MLKISSYPLCRLPAIWIAFYSLPNPLSNTLDDLMPYCEAYFPMDSDDVVFVFFSVCTIKPFPLSLHTVQKHSSYYPSGPTLSSTSLAHFHNNTFLFLHTLKLLPIKLSFSSAMLHSYWSRMINRTELVSLCWCTLQFYPKLRKWFVVWRMIVQTSLSSSLSFSCT